MTTTATRQPDGTVKVTSERAVAVVSTSRARRAWDEFEVSLRKSLSKAIALGKELLDLKEKCEHGEFGRYFSDHEDQAEGALPFVYSWANKLMRIAANDAISNVSHARDLPVDIETVYELATMTAPALEAAIEAGKVTPSTTRAEAKAIKREAEPEKVREAPRKTAAEVLADCHATILDAVGQAIADYPELRGLIAARLELLQKELIQ